MLRKSLPIAFALGMALSLGSAHAQTLSQRNYVAPEPNLGTDEYVADYAPESLPVPAAEAYTAAPTPDFAPRVYGWTFAPPRPSCGVYRYWNGVQCVDARDVPPNLD